MLERVSHWRKFLAEGLTLEEAEDFPGDEGSDRPLGSDAFIQRLEGLAGRVFRPQKPGAKGPRRQGKRARK